MAWTAELTYIENQGDKIRLIVVMTDGTQKFQQDFYASSVDAKWIKQRVLEKIAQLTSADASTKAVQLGPIDLTPDALVPQTPEQVYNQKRIGLFVMKQDLDLGLIDKATFDAAVADVLAAKGKVNS